MKVLFKLFFALTTIMLFMSGCTQKVIVKALNPAEVGEMASKKKVAIVDFKNDTYGLSGKIESKIASHKLDKKRYFTVLSRKDLNKIIDEQKLQFSDLMDERSITRIGKFTGAQAIVSGEVTTANVSHSSYIRERQRCSEYDKKNKCLRYQTYNVVCKTIRAEMSANINIVDVETALIIYGDSITKGYNADTCRYDTLLGENQVLNMLSNAIADKFVYKLTPHYIYFEVGLLDEIELDDVSDAQEDVFEASLEYIKAGRMDKAKRMLEKLFEDLHEKSYVVAYVLGVVNEAQGSFDEAKELYTISDELSKEPVDEINHAIVRIDKLIAKRDEARRQIDAK